jgi:hypothetical protein
MTLSMGTQFKIEADVARVAANLVTAWHSGDRSLLQSAVRQAASELGGATASSALQSELRELLLGVTDTLGPLLAANLPLDLRRGSQSNACYQLLLHAQGAAAAACPAPRG